MMRASGSGWIFACETSEGSSLCFNGGACEANISHICACPEGYKRDFDWFHFPNCAMRVNTERDFFIFFTCLVIPILVFYITVLQWRLRSLAKRLGRLTVVLVIFDWLLVLSVYVQQGCFEGCAISAIFVFDISAFVTQEVILLTLVPVYAVHHKDIEPLKRFLIRWNISTSVAVVAAGTAMAALCRNVSADHPHAEYNYAAFIMTAILWIAGIIDLGAMLLSARALGVELDPNILSAVSRKHFEDVKRRLRILQANSLSIALVSLLLLLSVPATISIYGSFPYFYILFYIQMVNGVILFVGGFFLFLKPGGHRTPTPVATAEAFVDEHDKASTAAYMIASKGAGE